MRLKLEALAGNKKDNNRVGIKNTNFRLKLVMRLYRGILVLFIDASF